MDAWLDGRVNGITLVLLLFMTLIVVRVAISVLGARETMERNISIQELLEIEDIRE